MSAAALGMMSSGWVWLVCDENASHLAVAATYGPGTMLVRSRQHRHPEGLSPTYGIGHSGTNSLAGGPFKVLGEAADLPSDLDRTRGAESAGGGSFEVLSRKPLRPGPVVAPGARSFHHASQALSPLSATALQQLNSTQSNKRFSQLPLAWRTPLEPLSTSNRYLGVPHALRYNSTSSLRGEKGTIEDLLSPAEELESEPEDQPLRADDRPAYESHIINNAMHARANAPWDANRWRGSGDDLSPLMCIRFVQSK
jgi:superoxide dismutase